MKGKAKIENPEEVQITITSTMPMGEWREVAEHLRGHSYKFSKFIQIMVERTAREYSKEIITKD